MDFCEKKKPLKASNSPQAYTLALNPPITQSKNHILCTQADFVN